MANAKMTSALSTTSTVCCRCDTDYTLHRPGSSSTITGSMTKLSCPNCTHAPCAKCIYTSSALVRVAHTNDIPIRSPRQEQEAHIRLCCACGLAEDVDVTKLYRSDGARAAAGPAVLDVAGFAVRFRKHRCQGCAHKCCRECACFVDAAAVGAAARRSRSRPARSDSVGSRASRASLASLRASIGSAIAKAAGKTGAAIAKLKARDARGDDADPDARDHREQAEAEVWDTSDVPPAFTSDAWRERYRRRKPVPGSTGM